MSIKSLSPFQKKLQSIMDDYVHLTYAITRKYPKDELYGSVSQHHRSSLSAVLNYIEGYARRRKTVQLNFYETAYGSLSESRYLYAFALKENGSLNLNTNKQKLWGRKSVRCFWSEITSVERDIDQLK